MCSDYFCWLIPVVLLAIGLIVVYYIFLVRVILDMLHHQANTVLLSFAFVSLIPLPPIVIMGILVMIIWNAHKKNSNKS
ncbi:MAG: hypothetical protein CO189_01480 [candidate division Zixibacteria bacterium CG_4_9_14_3_um_filter_46_8]|nr:MAG: hypothetical protein CO189_01480 [candidate division Zixibacteria bacterium CG_4_9_14_3_um_filter_46_8]